MDTMNDTVFTTKVSPKHPFKLFLNNAINFLVVIILLIIIYKLVTTSCEEYFKTKETIVNTPLLSSPVAETKVVSLLPPVKKTIEEQMIVDELEKDSSFKEDEYEDELMKAAIPAEELKGQIEYNKDKNKLPSPYYNGNLSVNSEVNTVVPQIGLWGPTRIVKPDYNSAISVPSMEVDQVSIRPRLGKVN